MREEIAYNEMQEEMEQKKQGQQAMDPTMKDQQSTSSTRAGTADPTRKDEAINVDARTRQTDQRDAQGASGADRMPAADGE
jgi:hypothetical protein